MTFCTFTLISSGWRFLDNHGATFAFGLDVTGASITNVVGNNGATYGAPLTNVDAGDGVGGSWPYGLLGTNFSGGGHVNSDDLVFDVKKTGVDLTLSDLIQTLDKHGVALWFVADVGNPAGKTGYVGATSTLCLDCTVNEQTPGTPIPGAVWLFGTVLAGGAGYGRWRKKRKAQLAVAA